MRRLIENRDLRTLFEGVAGVAAAGLLMGLAMQPDLDAREIAGPQMLAPPSGVRMATTEVDRGIAAYKGKVPDYVYGTDWAQPLVVAEYPEPAPDAETYAADASATVEDEPPMPVKRVTWREPPREAAFYPSVTGDTTYPSELPPAPPPPDEADGG